MSFKLRKVRKKRARDGPHGIGVHWTDLGPSPSCHPSGIFFQGSLLRDGLSLFDELEYGGFLIGVEDFDGVEALFKGCAAKVSSDGRVESHSEG